MFEINGKYGSAKVFTDLVDNDAISQVINMLNQPFAEGQTIRMMPDIHAGAGCTIGTTMTATGKICPNLVGTDIGCGMYAVRLEETDVDFAALDACIRQHIPYGFSIHDKPLKMAGAINLKALRCEHSCDTGRIERALGSLGGGNHFIEMDRDKAGHLWLVIHSGSRHLGMAVAKFYQGEAVKRTHDDPQYRNVPDALCWCEGDLLDRYVHDMRITQAYAVLNRKAMAQTIMDEMGLHPTDEFTTIHNYLDTDNMIIRKGAVAAEDRQRLIIPMNMRDGALLCVGKGNPDWNCSAPHGAGRLMSRSAAKQQIALSDFEASMEGIWTNSVRTSTIDESPMAYKPMESIVDNISDTVDVVDVIKPVYNFKAGA